MSADFNRALRSDLLTALQADRREASALLEPLRRKEIDTRNRAALRQASRLLKPANPSPS